MPSPSQQAQRSRRRLISGGRGVAACIHHHHPPGFDFPFFYERTLTLRFTVVSEPFSTETLPKHEGTRCGSGKASSKAELPTPLFPLLNETRSSDTAHTAYLQEGRQRRERQGGSPVGIYTVCPFHGRLYQPTDNKNTNDGRPSQSQRKRNKQQLPENKKSRQNDPIGCYIAIGVPFPWPFPTPPVSPRPL